MDCDQHDEATHAIMMFENKKEPYNADVKKLMVLNICALQVYPLCSVAHAATHDLFLRNVFARGSTILSSWTMI